LDENPHPLVDNKIYGCANGYHSSHTQVKYLVSSASVTQEFLKHISAVNLLYHTANI